MPRKTTPQKNSEREIRGLVQFMTYLGYAVLMIFGYTREAFRYFFPAASRRQRKGYAPLVRDFDDFYTRRLYYRIRDCWNRPIDSRPGRVIGVMERESKDYNVTFNFTGRIIPCLNFASYNYLGFTEDVPSITQAVCDQLDRFGVAPCTSSTDFGHSTTLAALELKVAAFVGKDAAIACGMGFATNFGNIPALFCKDTLVISDSLNHSSLVSGVRLSKSKVKVFPHNNLRSLEKILRAATIEGQPRTHKKWKRIVILVEGVYSMEGEIVDLKRIVELKKKYKALVYVDEAHSIGALGVTGRGVCEHCGIDPNDIDILMGTFTKSFASVGGYLAADRHLINFLRRTASTALYADAMSPACAQQALSSLQVILGEDGTDLGKRRITQLAENSRFFREGLIKLGLTVYGEWGSPVIPAMLYHPSKMPGFSRECLKRNLAVVVVGYPATPLIESRCRFCISAAHTRADLEHALKLVDEVAGEVMIRYDRPGIHWFQ